MASNLSRKTQELDAGSDGNDCGVLPGADAETVCWEGGFRRLGTSCIRRDGCCWRMSEEGGEGGRMRTEGDTDHAQNQLLFRIKKTMGIIFIRLSYNNRVSSVRGFFRSAVR
ncbi:hypothetical protein AMECASPLE_037107 [Ameca splendens]|uniref:Uncharacterized protein n=1 Tax=Ameca splendens TaxID=208324 RepID=A0ABV1A382_9TELE